MSKMRASFLSISLLLAGTATLAAVQPERGVLDERIRTALYSPDQIYRLQGTVGYETDIQFEPGEHFVGMGAGDVDAVAFVGQENHLFLKPKAARVETNLTILTDRRQYQIDYTASVARYGTEPQDAVFVLRFTYAQDPDAAKGAQDAQRLDSRLQQPAHPEQVNEDYWYCGQPSLRPVAASDDGVHTRLKFSATAELPAIFVRNDDGSESLLNFNVVDGDIIVHRVARRFVVRRGRLTGCILNAAFNGGGERLSSGTVAPDVHRDTRGAAP